MGIFGEIKRAMKLRNDGLALDLDVARAEYEAVSDNPQIQRERRAPSIEYSDEDGMFPAYKRGQAINIGRDTRRNSSFSQGMETQFKLNVIGTGPKAVFHSENENWNERAERWFNRSYAKNCDGKMKPGVFGGRHLADQVSIAVTTTQRDGDLICFFDEHGIIPDGAGKLSWFEGDQLVEISDFDKHKADIAARLGIADGTVQQAVGLLFDGYGRLHGFAVQKKNGAGTATFKETTILPIETATLLSAPWRFGQDRGISEQMSQFNDVVDLAEFRRAVILRGKTQGGVALAIKRRDSGKRASYRSSETDKDGNTRVTESDSPSLLAKAYRNIEKWARNAVVYIGVDEEVQPISLSGDVQEYDGFSSSIGISSGFAVGLTRLHSQGKADASYSASMAEMGMDRKCFQWWQKWAERYLLDWIAFRAVGWAIKTGRLPKQKGWHDFSWTDWTTIEGINPDREASAKEKKLDNFEIDYEDLLGAQWKKKLLKRHKQDQFLADHHMERKATRPMNQPTTTGDDE